MRFVRLIPILLLTLAFCHSSSAKQCDPATLPAMITTARDASIFSESEYTKGLPGKSLTSGSEIPDDFLLETGQSRNSRAEVRFSDGVVLRLRSDSLVEVRTQEHKIFLKRGAAVIRVNTESGRTYQLRTTGYLSYIRHSTVSVTTYPEIDEITVSGGSAVKVVDLASGLPVAVVAQ